MNVDKNSPPNTKIASPERVQKRDVSRTNSAPDDLDIIILHEDFSNLISLATKAKETRQKIEAVAGQNYVLPSVPITKLQPEQIFAIVDRMRDAHVSSGVARAPILRGQYPITDSLIEDMMLDLQNDHESGEQWLNQVTKKPSKSASIAQKYSKWQTDILMNWMIENVESPFPNEDAVAKLGQTTGLTDSQVINWTTNVRKRNRKATCEGSKKPHHFIDFLFLVSDRDTKAGVPSSRKRQSSMLDTNSKPAPAPVPAPTMEPLRLTRFSIDSTDDMDPDECISSDIFDEVAFQDQADSSNLGDALDDFGEEQLLMTTKEHCDSTDFLIKSAASFDLIDEISEEELENIAEIMKMEV